MTATAEDDDAGGGEVGDARVPEPGGGTPLLDAMTAALIEYRTFCNERDPIDHGAPADVKTEVRHASTGVKKAREMALVSAYQFIGAYANRLAGTLAGPGPEGDE